MVDLNVAANPRLSNSHNQRRDRIADEIAERALGQLLRKNDVHSCKVVLLQFLNDLLRASIPVQLGVLARQRPEQLLKFRDSLSDNLGWTKARIE